MRYDIRVAGDYLRAELSDRETVEETRDFLAALVAAAMARRMDRILICVQSSRPIFRVEQYEASRYLKALAARPALKVALVSIRHDVRAAHEYLEVLAGQQGASLRSFSHEAMAVEWLRSREARPRASARGRGVKIP